VMDLNEGDWGSWLQQQRYSARESDNSPQLVLTWG
jgi:hypothetical protein